MVLDNFVDDEAEEFLAEGWIEASFLGERTEAGDLNRFTIGVGGSKADRGLMLADALGDLEAFGQEMHERSIDVVDAAAAVFKDRIVVHVAIV